mmetsp:Transcript_146624/g.256038  ORF Transcript_146624/g.256038 Transcript_146624/m.256038 type:complete len:284 (+) Transcript_146624:829-1680(+)
MLHTPSFLQEFLPEPVQCFRRRALLQDLHLVLQALSPQPQHLAVIFQGCCHVLQLLLQDGHLGLEAVPLGPKLLVHAMVGPCLHSAFGQGKLVLQTGCPLLRLGIDMLGAGQQNGAESHPELELLALPTDIIKVLEEVRAPDSGVGTGQVRILVKDEKAEVTDLLVCKAVDEGHEAVDCVTGPGCRLVGPYRAATAEPSMTSCGQPCLLETVLQQRHSGAGSWPKSIKAQRAGRGAGPIQGHTPEGPTGGSHSRVPQAHQPQGTPTGVGGWWPLHQTFHRSPL